MFTTFNQNNLTTSLRGRLQNNSTCFKREHSDRQTHKIGHNILSCSLVSLHFITPLSLCLSLACICTHTHNTHKNSSGNTGWEALDQPQSTGPRPNKETINHVWAAVWVSALWTTTTLSHLSPLKAEQGSQHTMQACTLSSSHLLTDVEEEQRCTLDSTDTQSNAHVKSEMRNAWKSH